MQVLAVFLAVPIVAVIAALTPQDIVQFAVVRQRCGNEFTVDPTAISRIRAGEMINDPEFDCYMACILEGMNLMTNGRLNVNAAVQKVPDADFRNGLVDAITACAEQQGSNKCETAHRLLGCMRERGVADMLRGR